MEASTRKTIDALNLASVQRIDPCAVSIIDRCTYASLYSYAKNEGWQKTEIEGPMLVYRRADHPTHSFIIANRHSRQDFIEPISATLQLCLKSSYIMMKKPEEKEIFGIWICDSTDCERIYNLLHELVAECAKSPPQVKASSESPNLLDLIIRPTEIADGDRNQPLKANKKSGEDMPAMLQKLLCEERQLPRGSLPKGAVSADQVEKQLLFDQAAKQKNTEPLKKFVAEPTITSNFSCMSLGALSTTATRGSEGPLNIVPDDLNNSAAGCSSNVSTLKNIDPPEKDLTAVEKDAVPQNKSSSVPSTGLNKEQLVQALEHLLRTDDDFVGRLHLAYADSLNLRLGI